VVEIRERATGLAANCVQSMGEFVGPRTVAHGKVPLYRTGPTPSLKYLDLCCGQGEFSFLSARHNSLRPADRLDHIQMVSELIVESLQIGSCGQV